ncbi:acyclic terpene utilization AtuA family protein [Pokkaliibacter sp. CJK22405]|uniref:acyclic terpene utilization AtuA family protein n=1 Tax=Pokkaliibacter sp. CJK22405 TaxID=3384615 RepID=UPI0039850A27
MTTTSPTSPRIAHIGCGAGFAGDRPQTALALVEDLARRDGPAYLFYELLAERTLAEAQLRKLNDPNAGYATHLFAFLEPVLERCLEAGIPIITNGGAANPVAAATRLQKWLVEKGLRAKIACVLGDDLTPRWEDAAWLPEDLPRQDVVSCNVYIGAQAITDALNEGANIVLGGRIADPSLVVGAVRHAHQWAEDNWDKVALATAAGHLLECCAQVTGGYFSDPGRKDVEDLLHLGCPIAEVGSDGSLVITKAEPSGGCVTLQTVKEQLLYEVHNPAAYLTPDVTLDITQVTLEQIAPHRVAVKGVKGHPAPATLKGNFGLRGLWFGEAGISYAGPNAVARGQQAISLLKARIHELLPELSPQLDLIGISSLFNDTAGDWHRQVSPQAQAANTLQDVRVRLGVVGRHPELLNAALQEVEALYLNGPAGGGGVRRQLGESLRTHSFLIPREQVTPRLQWWYA